MCFFLLIIIDFKNVFDSCDGVVACNPQFVVFIEMHTINKITGYIGIACIDDMPFVIIISNAFSHISFFTINQACLHPVVGIERNRI